MAKASAGNLTTELGMSGSITFGEPKEVSNENNVVRWTCNIVRDAHDATVMRAMTDPLYGWRERVLGHASASGTIEYLADPVWTISDNNSLMPDGPEGNGPEDTITAAGTSNPAILSLYSSAYSSIYFTGSVFVTNIQFVSEVDGLNRYSCDWVSHGKFADAERT